MAPSLPIHSTLSDTRLAAPLTTRRENPVRPPACQGPATRTRTIEASTPAAWAAECGAGTAVDRKRLAAKRDRATQRVIGTSLDVKFAGEGSMFLDETEAGIGLCAHQPLHGGTGFDLVVLGDFDA